MPALRDLGSLAWGQPNWSMNLRCGTAGARVSFGNRDRAGEEAARRRREACRGDRRRHSCHVERWGSDAPVDHAVEVDAVVESGVGQVDKVAGGDGHPVHEDLRGERALCVERRGSGDGQRGTVGDSQKSAPGISDWRQRRVIDPWAMHRGGDACRDRTSEVLKVAVGLGMTLDRGVFSAGGAGFVHRRADGSIFSCPETSSGEKADGTRLRKSVRWTRRTEERHSTPRASPRSRRMPAVDFWDHPTGAPSAAPSVDGVACPPPRVVLIPVDDSDHAQRAVAWACEHLLRGGERGDVAHPLHVVPAVHASTAMAYGGPPVWMEDLSTFSQSLYAVTIPSDPRHAPRYKYPPHFLAFFSDARVVAFYRWRQTRRPTLTSPTPARSPTTRPWPPPARRSGSRSKPTSGRGTPRIAAPRRLSSRSVSSLCSREYTSSTSSTSPAGIPTTGASARSSATTRRQASRARAVMAPHGKGRVKEFFVGRACNHCLHRCEVPLVLVRPERVDVPHGKGRKRPRSSRPRRRDADWGRTRDRRRESAEKTGARRRA